MLSPKTISKRFRKRSQHGHPGAKAHRIHALYHDYRVADFVSAAEKLLELYPQANEIKFLLAEVYERQGQDAKSLSLFQEVLAAKKIVALSGQAVQQLDRGYLESWVEALEARLGPTESS